MISSILSSCSKVIPLSKHVSINNNNIESFSSHLKVSNVIKKKLYSSYPLNYNMIDECNFIILTQLLNIGSGYRVLLHKYLDRGSWETILYGCFTMFLSGKTLNTDFYENFKLFDCITYFQIPLDVEESVSENSPIKISKPSLLKPLAEKITFLINDLGRVLRNYQCNNITEFLIKSTEHTRLSDIDEKSENFELIFKRLLTLRGFQDEAIYNGEKVYFYKKAQLVMFSLGKFKNEIPCFDFGSVKLTVFADNVLPAMLISNKLLTVSNDLAEKIENLKNITESEEVELRATTIIVCDKICEIVGCEAADLDEYLWKLGKEGENRVTKRHVNMNTYFY